MNLRSLALLVALALAGCKKDAPPPPTAPDPQGAWVLAGVLTDKGPAPKEKLTHGAELKWTFEPKGVFKSTVTLNGESKTVTGSWLLEGDALVITEPKGEPQRMTATRTDGKLSVVNRKGSVTLQFDEVK